MKSMNIKEYIKERLSIGRKNNISSREEDGLEESTEITNDLSNPELELIREKISEKRERKLERIFANMAQSRRVGLVTEYAVPHGAWLRFTNFVRSNEKREEKWGLKELTVDTNQGNVVCVDHDEPIPVKERELEKSEKNSFSSSQGISTELTGEVGSDIKILQSKTGGSETKSNRLKKIHSGKSSNVIYLFECGSNYSDCKLNRKSFVTIGDECMVRGPKKYEALDSMFEQAVKASENGDISDSPEYDA